LLDEIDFVILPVVNPDGYAYTQKDRMWRKTRSKSSTCIGTDGNRNFDFQWGELGASANPCHDTYRGVKAFSEVETQILRDAVLELKENCKFYLSLHSYGNMMLYPWGWTSELPDTWKEIHEIAQTGAEAIQQATGTRLI
jgi:carboxypeptidase A2